MLSRSLGRRRTAISHLHLVDHRSSDRNALDYLREIKNHDQVEVVRCDDEEFNFAKMNNDAVGLGDAEFVVFLNNDTEVIEPEWLTPMLEFAQRDGVGAVGAKLLYPDRLIQHAGVIVGLGGVAGARAPGGKRCRPWVLRSR